MRSWTTVLITVTVAIVARPNFSCGHEAAGTARLSVHVDQAGPQISPMLWGIFFEEINCAGDGGLYAELVRNRSFEDSDKPEPWSLLAADGSVGRIAIDRERPMSERNARSLKLEIASTAEGRVGVANGGYWGISVREGATYDLSLCARAGSGFQGPLTVTLESATGKVYARTEIAGLASEWKRFQDRLTSSGTDPKARLVVAVEQPGTVWLDMVSLIPQETWKKRPNGLRPDLAEMLAGLRPSFVRFPGGCWVEGDTLQFATRWKRTIGDLGDRWNQWNIWQYYSTNGLGYHEYLQMCEDLGAEPLFVINCGMSHKENVPMDQMGEWVQDALDAIEYANGPAESKWGAERAKAGHPAPFGLKYIEIGNENGGPAYQERYALFYDAIRARHPGLKIIANVPTTQRPADIIDEHYYSSPEFFISNARKYDGYDRKGPKIYVGEYAVTAGCGQGNLRGAIGEAAFMIGMERNSDVVVMASYAPLFANVNYKKWNPDLIDFDSSRVYGIPSYYVQKMFSENRGDVVLATQMEAAAAPVQPETKRGAIGVGTWATQAEYKDIKVIQDGKILYQSDFREGMQAWQPKGGEWSVKEGALQQTAGGDDCRATVGDASWADYTYALKARKLGGAEGFLVMFRVRDSNHWLWWNLGGWGNARHAIEQCEGGGKSIVGNEVAGRIETGRWYDIRIELRGPRIRCYLDGKLIHDVVQGQSEPLYAVASQVQSSGDVILKVVNVSSEAYETQIDFGGVEAFRASAIATVLTSADPSDENSLSQPTKVAPVTEKIENVGRSLRRTFAPHSLTILRLKTSP